MNDEILSVEDYLKILYPFPEELDEQRKKQYEKDKLFIEKWIEEINNAYDWFIDRKEEKGEYQYTLDMVNRIKREHDVETIVNKFLKGFTEEAEYNPFIVEHFDTFNALIDVELQEYLKRKNQHQTTNRRISFQEILDLTEEYLETIDDTQEYLSEFRKLREEGRIVEKGKDGGYYSSKDKTLICDYDGKVENTTTPVHEFMHYLEDLKSGKGHSGMGDNNIFYEYLSIYYELSFAKFLEEKGILTYDEQVKSRLSNNHYNMHNSGAIIFSLYGKYKKKGNIEIDDIAQTIMEQNPESEKTMEDKLEHLATYCKHSMPRELSVLCRRIFSEHSTRYFN